MYAFFSRVLVSISGPVHVIQRSCIFFVLFLNCRSRLSRLFTDLESLVYDSKASNMLANTCSDNIALARKYTRPFATYFRISYGAA